MNAKLVVALVAVLIVGALVYKKKNDKFSPYLCGTRNGGCIDMGSSERTAWGNSVS